MDSMRHLSTSLPHTSSRQRHEQSADILADFKAAALSVTNLYKTAASSQTRARSAGYQDALDDLLAFLDKENLGLMDGEGWKVRQWATERLDTDGMTPRQTAATTTSSSHSLTDDEEDTGTMQQDDKEEERSSSPDAQRKPIHLHSTGLGSTDDLDAASHHRRVVSEPPPPQFAAPSAAAAVVTSTTSTATATSPPSPSIPHRLPAHPSVDFTFQSPHAYPATGAGSMDVDRTVGLRTVRPGRPGRRNTDMNRVGSLNLNFGGAGSKRKMPYPDFFDISGFHDGSGGAGGGGGSGFDRKDGSGPGRGGKRGRFV